MIWFLIHILAVAAIAVGLVPYPAVEGAAVISFVFAMAIGGTSFMIYCESVK
jgi:hypothetical protein